MKNLIVVSALIAAALNAPAKADDSAAPAPSDVSASAPSGLDQRVAALEKDLAALASAQGTPVSIYADPVRGLRFANADGTYGLQFSGLFQEDSRSYIYDGLNSQKGYTGEAANEFVDARSRLIVDALLGPRVKLRYQEDFSNNGTGPILLDAYGELKLASWATLRLGQFKNPLDIERWRNTPALDFIQYGYTGGLVVDRSQGALLEISDPKQVIYFSGGAFDGDTDAGTTPVVQAYNSDKDAVAKLFVQPFHALGDYFVKGLGFGAAASAGNHTFAPEQSYKSEGQLSIFTLGGGKSNASFADGAGYRVVPQAYWFWRNIDVLGEYVHDAQRYRFTTTQQNDTVASEAWQAQAGWVITGEHASFDGLKLDSANSHSFGALQLVARVQGENFDEGAESVYNETSGVVTYRLFDPATSVKGLTSWTLGLNYVPVNDVKFLVNWDETEFADGGANVNAAGKTLIVNRPTEQILQVRGQVAF